MSYVAPLVSIVFTTYNAERFIRTSLAAALAQDYPNFEVIVADDGSTDDTERICRAFSDPRLRFFKLGRVGRCKALNQAVGAAKGKYIANNDADDISVPHRLSSTVNFLESHPWAAYLATGFLDVDTFFTLVPPELMGPRRLGSTHEVIWFGRADVFRRNPFIHSTLVYPKSTWTAIGGYDETLRISEDYDFYLRGLQCGPAALLPVETVLWFSASSGYFRQKSLGEYLRVMLRIKRRAYCLLNLRPWLLIYHYLWIAYYCINRIRREIFHRSRMSSSSPLGGGGQRESIGPWR